MNLQLDQTDSIWDVFKAAARKTGLVLTTNDIEALAERVAISLLVQPNPTAKLNDLTTQTILPPSGFRAAALASHVRGALGVGDVDPLLNLPELLADQFNVLVFPLDQKSIAGACALIDGAAFLFLSTTFEIEILFMCAHELAHLAILSARREQESIATLDRPNVTAQSPKDPYEYFADAFALELLIPTRGLGVALREVRRLLRISASTIGDVELLYLSRIFGVSFLLAAKRCERAKLLPKGGAASLHRFMLENFGGPEDRATQLDLPPRPQMNIPAVPKRIEVATTAQIRGR
jgi:Zn-dependent peptidase ImmA (M78 family)